MGWIPMSAYVDFATLKAEVKIEDVAQWLRLELKPSGNKLRGPCPACNQGGTTCSRGHPQQGNLVLLCSADVMRLHQTRLAHP